MGGRAALVILRGVEKAGKRAPWSKFSFGTESSRATQCGLAVLAPLLSPRQVRRRTSAAAALLAAGTRAAALRVGA